MISPLRGFGSCVRGGGRIESAGGKQRRELLTIELAAEPLDKVAAPPSLDDFASLRSADDRGAWCREPTADQLIGLRVGDACAVGIGSLGRDADFHVESARAESTAAALDVVALEFPLGLRRLKNAHDFFADCVDFVPLHVSCPFRYVLMLGVFRMWDRTQLS